MGPGRLGWAHMSWLPPREGGFVVQPSDESETAADPLADLRTRYQRYVISCDPRLDPPRYTAVARELSVSPWCVVTSSLEELSQVLAASEEGPGTRS